MIKNSEILLLILKFCQLYEKYKEDNRSLTLSEENLILFLDTEFCEKGTDVYHLSEEERRDIAI